MSMFNLFNLKEKRKLPPHFTMITTSRFERIVVIINSAQGCE